MPNKRYAEFKVGIFVVIATLIVLFTVFWAKGFTINLSQNDFKVYFPKISGLNEGDQVSVNGVRKGKIDKIELEGDSVKIKFSLDKSVSIKKDYSIFVSTTELTGGKVLYIEPGKSTESVDPDIALHGSPGVDFGSLLNSFGEITKDVKSLLGKFQNTTDSLSIVINNVNEIVGDGFVKSNIRTTLSNLASSSANLNQLVSESRSGIGRLTDKAGTTFDNIDNTVTDNGRELKNTLTEIQNLTSTVDTLVASLNIVVNDIQNKKSGIGKFMSDDQFFNNVNNTLTEIEKLTKKIRKDGVKINLF